MSGERVLVTGGAGFIGVHCIGQLLEAGYTVRATVRSLGREAEIRQMLAVGGVQPGDRLSLVKADLLQDAGWDEAAAGCAYVLHVASPFPAATPKHEDELIGPAREGTLRVLRAARDAGVRRVVVTSSFAAIGYGGGELNRPFDESDWTEVNGPGVTAYARSKTLAERAAWDFVGRAGNGLELSVVNPVGVFGPAWGPDLSTSVAMMQRMLEGKIPGYPRIRFGVVDVRDVADLHLRAMTHPEARGERFLAVAGEFLAMVEVGQILKKELGPAAAKVPTRQLPDWAVRLVALFDPAARLILPELGKAKNGTNAKARRLLGWQPRSNEESLVSSANSLLALGLVRSGRT